MDKIIIAAVALTFLSLIITRRVTIYEYERGLLYRRGKFQRILEPGKYWFFSMMHTVKKVDIRTRTVSIPGQEVLSADNISLKVSLVAIYKVVEPHLAINLVTDYHQALYLLLQVHLRDLIGSMPIDDVLTNRKEIGQQLYEQTVKQATELGLSLSMVSLKDIMFPGNLKQVFAQVVNARKEGLAALERARGESAALRNLANAAKLLENNPALMQLRLFQVLGEQSGNTVILTSNIDEPTHLQILQKDKK